MKVFLRGRSGAYNASGEWRQNELVILKGSKIRAGKVCDFKASKQAVDLWDSDIFDENNCLKKDVVFKSPSTAAQFVTKNSVNGWKAWKTKDGDSLKEATK